MRPELPDLGVLLPGEDQIWLCVIYGSASFGALGPNSDIDVLAEGDANAIAAWAAEAERLTGREIKRLRRRLHAPPADDGPADPRHAHRPTR